MNEFWILYGEVVRAEGRLLLRFWYVYAFLALCGLVAVLCWRRQK